MKYEDSDTKFQVYQTRISKARRGFSDVRAANWPLHIDLDINHSCNSACKICYRRTSLNQQDGVMSRELYVKIIDEAEKWGRLSLNLDHGGEPLLHPHLDSYIAYARDHGITNVMLHTNAISLTADLSKSLIEAGLTRITFSLDAATAKTYAHQRGSQQNFYRVQRNIANFLNIREQLGNHTPFIQVSFVITKVNQNEVQLFRGQWESSVDDVHFRKFNDPGLELGERFALDAQDTVNKDSGSPYCTMLNWRLSLRWDGTVFPCCHPNGFLMPVGNANESSIHDIWTGETLGKMVLDHQMGELSNYPGCKMCLAQAPDYIKYQ